MLINCSERHAIFLSDLFQFIGTRRRCNHAYISDVKDNAEIEALHEAACGVLNCFLAKKHNILKQSQGSLCMCMKFVHDRKLYKAWVVVL
jgi:hypothetical protein